MKRLSVPYLQTLLYYIILLLLPTQLGLHFWPSFSYVQGLRVDYLSPILYTTDAFLILLFLVTLLSKNRVNFRALKSFSLFIGIVIISILFSQSPMSGWYHLLKLFEFLFFGWFTARFLNTKKELVKACFVFSLGILGESILTIAQYIHQGSLNGVFYFLGERSFSGVTPGIANASINGELILRPYATFPHPNVLAGYLVIGMIYVLDGLKRNTARAKKTFFIITLFLGSGALFLTMSRVAILLWFFILIFEIGVRIRKKLFLGKPLLVLVVAACIIGLSLSPLRDRFTGLQLSDESVVQREQLITASFYIIQSHPFFGVGLGNFLNALSKEYGVSRHIFYLQPVHNIFLLAAVETGMLGVGMFFFFLYSTYRNVLCKKIKGRKSIVVRSYLAPVLLTTIVILGMFDHYFLTLQQGQLLFSFVLGLCWVQGKNDTMKKHGT